MQVHTGNACAPEQVNHIQAYSMDALVGDELEAVVKHCETHGLYFGFSLVAAVTRVLNASAAGVVAVLNTYRLFRCCN